jgi:hypothetical protein
MDGALEVCLLDKERQGIWWAGGWLLAPELGSSGEPGTGDKVGFSGLPWNRRSARAQLYIPARAFRERDERHVVQMTCYISTEGSEVLHLF